MESIDFKPKAINFYGAFFFVTEPTYIKQKKFTIILQKLIDVTAISLINDNCSGWNNKFVSSFI